MKRTLVVLTTLLGLVLFLVGTGGQAGAQGADDAGEAAAGKAVYEQSCAGCHAADGTGVAGRGRPLTGIAAQGDRATHIASITDGKGANMPAFGERLSADEISQVTSYLRLTFVEEAAAEETTTELAVTGVGSAGLAILGMTMVAGGIQLTVWSRRKDS